MKEEIGNYKAYGITVHIYSDGTYWCTNWSENHISHWKIKDGDLFLKHYHSDDWEVCNTTSVNKFKKIVNDWVDKQLLE